MHRPLVPLAFAIACVGVCACSSKRREAGGVVVEERGDGLLLRAGAISAALPRAEPAESISLAPFPDRPAVRVEVSIGSTRHRLIDREVVTNDGQAAIRHRLEGSSAELLLTIDPARSAIVLTARASQLLPGEKLRLHLTMERRDPVVLAEGGPYESGERADARTRFVALGTTTTVIASPRDLEVSGDASVSIGAFAEAGAAPITEVRAFVATAPSLREGALLGARLAGVPARVGGDLIVETRDAHTQKPVPARVWLDGMRGVPGAPITFDPARDAERTIPLVDVTSPRTTVKLPEGAWVLRATRGPGWSVARRDVTIAPGDATRVVLELAEESPRPEWIGCDFHVHARPSFDARAVSYEDRVRSLVAVGVDCAAATEHDHVGDHGPAAAALHLDDRFRALTGVELTTVSPGFGHFNVYPWPSGAAVPKAAGTTPNALFDAVRALPGSFIFQLNHPRMGHGPSSIGYFDHVALDPKTGTAKGPYAYRRDYDAIEVFNGYDLRDLKQVRAIITEWTQLLDRGEVHVATGSSDSHGISFPWAGFPRTMIRVGSEWRTSGRAIDGVVDALKRGRAYVTSGPLIELRADGAGLGDTVAHPQHVRLEIARTSWLGAPSVKLLLGVGPIDAPAPTVEGDHWVVEATVPKTTRKRALIAIVEAPLIGEAPGLTGFDRALAVTNPIWITP